VKIKLESLVQVFLKEKKKSNLKDFYIPKISYGDEFMLNLRKVKKYKIVLFSG
jgi:hypothetical protein